MKTIWNIESETNTCCDFFISSQDTLPMPITWEQWDIFAVIFYSIGVIGIQPSTNTIPRNREKKDLCTQYRKNSIQDLKVLFLNCTIFLNLQCAWTLDFLFGMEISDKCTNVAHILCRYSHQQTYRCTCIYSVITNVNFT